MIDLALPADQDGQHRSSRISLKFAFPTTGTWGMPLSLCWSSNTDESKVSLKVRLLLAIDGFLFEDVPRCAALLSIWASAGAIWFLWLDYLCSIRHRC
jgi:hypothetical protein